MKIINAIRMNFLSRIFARRLALIILAVHPWMPSQAAEPASEKQASPSKEQTVAFIVKRAANATVDFSPEGETEWIKKLTRKTTKIEIEDCKVIFVVEENYEAWFGGKLTSARNTETLYVVPISLVERVKLNGEALLDLSCEDKVISATAKMKSKISFTREVAVEPVKHFLLSSVSLPVPIEDNKRLEKAFNHLRKLCGAPKPISFD